MLTFVTGNKDKLREVQEILQFPLESVKIDLPELQGEPIDIITAKVLKAVEEVNRPVFVDDSCLCFNALNGLPGPYVKWFHDKIGSEALFKMVSPFRDHSGYVLCLIGYCEPGQEPLIFEGRTTGRIVSPRGTKGFKWDDVFEPDGFDQTFGEMDQEEKNEISTRKRALEKLREYLESRK
jgi:inosine triphosphate pyrophosphatase